MRAFIYESGIITVHHGADLERILKNPKVGRELTKEEIDNLGKFARFAGPHNTSVDEDGVISFNFDNENYLKELEEYAKDNRDCLLRESDWRYLNGNEKYRDDKWDKYRKKLRDLPEQEGFPDDIVWPTKPE